MKTCSSKKLNNKGKRLDTVIYNETPRLVTRYSVFSEYNNQLSSEKSSTKTENYGSEASLSNYLVVVPEKSKSLIAATSSLFPISRLISLSEHRSIICQNNIALTKSKLCFIE